MSMENNYDLFSLHSGETTVSSSMSTIATSTKAQLPNATFADY